MESLSPQALVLIGLCFIWSGFVRSGLGFGGSVLSLPLLLIIHNDPVVFLPIISVHLLFFSALIAVQAKWRRWRSSKSEASVPTTVNWAFLKYSIPIMLLPKLLGVAGLIVLPCAWVGHLLGERFHRYSLQPGTATFMSYVGAALLAVSVIGIAEQVMKWQG